MIIDSVWTGQNSSLYVQTDQLRLRDTLTSSHSSPTSLVSSSIRAHHSHPSFSNLQSRIDININRPLQYKTIINSNSNATTTTTTACARFQNLHAYPYDSDSPTTLIENADTPPSPVTPTSTLPPFDNIDRLHNQSPQPPAAPSLLDCDCDCDCDWDHRLSR